MRTAMFDAAAHMELMDARQSASRPFFYEFGSENSGYSRQ